MSVYDPQQKKKQTGKPEAAVSEEDIKLIKKVHQILKSGDNVEIKNGPDGKPKLLKVSRELA